MLAQLMLYIGLCEVRKCKQCKNAGDALRSEWLHKHFNDLHASMSEPVREFAEALGVYVCVRMCVCARVFHQSLESAQSNCVRGKL